jgi:spermidine synthase
MSDRGTIISAVARARRLIVFSVAALGVSCVVTQLALMRELLSAFAGNEMVLGIVLGWWFLLMGVGTGLGRTADKLRNPLAVLAATQIFVAILPLLQVFLLRALRNVVFIRGAAVGVNETVIGVFIALLPYCVVAGYALTLACSLLAREEGATGIGNVYVTDSFGSIVGGVVFSFVLIRFFDHLAILVFPALFSLLAAAAIAVHLNRRWLAGMAMTLAVGVVAATFFGDADTLSTAVQYSPQRVVARANSPYGKLIVTESDGQFNFIENGVPVTSSRDDQHVEETVHYAMAQRPDAEKVLLVSGGFTGTAKEILKYGVASITYAELDPLLLKLGEKFLPDNLADSRIRIINTDGRLFIKQTADKYDVVIVDVPDPSTAQLNRFYTAEFFAEAKATLGEDGVLSFSLGHYENYVSPELARVLGSASQALKQSFQNVLMIPGGRIFFLASDGPLFADIGARIEQRQIQTKLVNRHYLDAMLTADRMADLERAASQPASVNTDFSPVLYFYHLRHWMSQFNVGFGVLQTALLVLFCVYLIRLRGPALVLFASGFAGSALEIVLLLAFQVLCGSVYHQVGVIVTVFMIGLALGAAWANRSSRRQEAHFKSAIDNRQSAMEQSLLASAATSSKEGGRRSLAFLALAIALLALLLPVLLPLINRMGDTAASLFLVKATIVLLTLLLAVLVGMQFPLANRLQFDGTVGGASRLYTADFIGACLGALLASTLLIPLIGVSGVCLVTAGLNLLGSVATCHQKRNIAAW